MKAPLILWLAAMLACTGCSSPLLRPITTTLSAAGGAVVGSVLSKGHPAAVAGGAAAGAVASETVFHLKSKSEQRAYQSGYQKALSDQMKSRYWHQQFRHAPGSSLPIHLPVSLPERITPDGVRLVPSTEFIPLQP